MTEVVTVGVDPHGRSSPPQSWTNAEETSATSISRSGQRASTASAVSTADPAQRSHCHGTVALSDHRRRLDLAATRRGRGSGHPGALGGDLLCGRHWTQVGMVVERSTG
jgi:hypothetical protein